MKIPLYLLLVSFVPFQLLTTWRTSNVLNQPPFAALLDLAVFDPLGEHRGALPASPGLVMHTTSASSFDQHPGSKALYLSIVSNASNTAGYPGLVKNESRITLRPETYRVYKETGTPTTLVSGEQKKWHKVTLTFDGPFANEQDSLNPFLNYRLDVVFTHSSGKSYKVPGYFAADGNAGETSASSGTKWRVHFSPDETGTWTYIVYFRTGPDIAVSDDPFEGIEVPALNGQTGTLTILPSDKTGKDLRGKGRLKYRGESLLVFTETGEYFRKAGADAPENFLAYQDFDNTPTIGLRRKTWAAHIQDWKPGDVTWKDGKGKGIIGAVNYLSDQGMNVFSFLTMNIKGDDKNVYPYVTDRDFTRIDVSKVDQWEMVMEHAQIEGMYLHFKLQERENNNLLNKGDLGTERKLYCREIIARFSHHLALNWNVGEENSQTDKQRKGMAEYIHDHDPYKSNIVIHTFPGEQEQVYRPLLGQASYFTGISIQTNTDNIFSKTREWVEASANAGKKWIVANDEQNPSNSGVATDAEYTGKRGTIADNSETIRKDVLWGNLMAGGAGVEYYFGSATGETDLTCQDFRSRAKSWKYARHALEFFNTYLSTTELQPFKNLSTGWGLYNGDEVFVLYLKEGGTSRLGVPQGSYTVRWFDPRNGGALQKGSVTDVGSGKVGIGNPPSDVTSDWVVLIRRVSSAGTAYQAEDRSAESGTTIDTLHAGYTERGYVDYGGFGSWMEWNTVKSTSGKVNLVFYYANGSTVYRQCLVKINGTTAGTINFIPTGSWAKWQTGLITVSLDSGFNTVRVVASSSQGGPNLDRMQIYPVASESRMAFNSAEKRIAPDVSVYPNPTAGKVDIVAGSSGECLLEIYNVHGVKVYTNKFAKKVQVNLRAFGSGEYYIHVQQNDNSFMRKVVLVK